MMVCLSSSEAHMALHLRIRGRKHTPTGTCTTTHTIIPRVKTGIISCLRKRAEKVCSDTKVDEEKNRLQEVFEANHYPPQLVKKTLSKKPRQPPQQEDREEDLDTLCLPYIKGLSEQIEREIRDLHIRAVFKTSLTLRHCLMKAKTPRNPQESKGVICSIPCECGKEYIGETGRTLCQPMTEHKRAVRNGDQNNALAVHVSKTQHSIQWEEAEVVTKEEHWTKRKIKEGLTIRDRRNNLNLDQGFQIDNNWFTL